MKCHWWDAEVKGESSYAGFDDDVVESYKVLAMVKGADVADWIQDVKYGRLTLGSQLQKEIKHLEEGSVRSW